MREDVSQALRIGPDAGMADRIVDITTTGRKSREPRRIETTFQRVGDSVYLTGVPMPRPRAWLLNLAADPEFTFHLKHGVVADLPATATVITDETERREILAPIVERFLATRDPNGPFPASSLDDWVRDSPLVRVSFREDDSDQSAIRAALDIGANAGARARTVDITTIGAKSGDPRRIEIWFHQIEGRWYITGVPPRPRGWFRNLETNPRFTFHLKNDVQADLSATARAITDAEERRVVFQGLLDGLTDPSITAILANVPPLEDWVTFSPLVEVSFDDLAS